jgi:hypothetical protein
MCNLHTVSMLWVQEAVQSRTMLFVCTKPQQHIITNPWCARCSQQLQAREHDERLHAGQQPSGQCDGHSCRWLQEE